MCGSCTHAPSPAYKDYRRNHADLLQNHCTSLVWRFDHIGSCALYSRNVHQISSPLAVFLTRLPCASIHPAYMRASSFTSLNTRSTSASLLGCFKYDGTRYGIGMAAFSGGVEPRNWRLDEGLRLVDPHRLAAPHNLRHLLWTRFEEMELSVFLCQPCVCWNR